MKEKDLKIGDLVEIEGEFGLVVKKKNFFVGYIFDLKEDLIKISDVKEETYHQTITTFKKDQIINLRKLN